MKTNIKSYKIYKPTRKLTGSAIQFNPDQSLNCIWLEIAPQIAEGGGPKPFDWENKIIFKLGTTDLLSLIYALEIVRTAQYKTLLSSDPDRLDHWMTKELGDKDGNLCNIFHNDQRGSTATLAVRANGAKWGGGFLIKVFKKHSDGKTKSYQVNVTPHEALGILYTLEKPLSWTPGTLTIYSKGNNKEGWNDEDSF